jgi:hypothetical protein
VNQISYVLRHFFVALEKLRMALSFFAVYSFPPRNLFIMISTPLILLNILIFAVCPVLTGKIYTGCLDQGSSSCPGGTFCNVSGSCDIIPCVSGGINGGCHPARICSASLNPDHPSTCSPICSDDGLRAEGVRGCRPATECEYGGNNGGCDPLVTCEIVEGGGILCGSCPDGFYRRTGSTLDPCVLFPFDDPCEFSACPEATNCIPTNDGRSHTCECGLGLVRYGGTCSVPNPCFLTPCHELATCRDLGNQTYSCGACPEGSYGDGFRYCTPLDECSLLQVSPCATGSSCVSVPGGYVCLSDIPGTVPPSIDQSNSCGECPLPDLLTCTLVGPNGGRLCLPENPCFLKSGRRCAVDTICVPVLGGYQCVCPDGATCAVQPSDPCMTNNGDCLDLQRCKPFTSGGRVCLEPVDCVQLNPCGDTGECQSVPGGFTCLPGTPEPLPMGWCGAFPCPSSHACESWALGRLCRAPKVDRCSTCVRRLSMPWCVASVAKPLRRGTFYCCQ